MLLRMNVEDEACGRAGEAEAAGTLLTQMDLDPYSFLVLECRLIRP